jgi:NAD(P)-dependent dehydrogenase (short-subunit alcohol dehydrogenase family)
MHDAYHTAMNLHGKTILVTGAARRVGRAIAEELAAGGARIVVHYHSGDDEAAALWQSLPDSLIVRADLRRPEAARAVVEAALDGTGRLDAVVSSAAGYARTPLAELTDEVWDAMLALNLSAPMRLARAAVPAGATAIVNLVDIAAWQPWPNYLAYSTAKAGLLHLTRCLAVELAPTVRVNAVAPGTVAFPDDWDEARRARQESRIPLGRSGSPADAARAVRFLLEEDYLTGVCLPVDGGAGLR